MVDPGSMTVSGSTLSEFMRSFTSVMQALPPELRSRVNAIRCNYFDFGSFDFVYARMNDRTVSQILAEFEPMPLHEIASGDVDGVRYHLHETAKPGPLDSDDVL